MRTEHVAGGTERFFVDAQACYERWDPETEPGLRLTRAADIPIDSEGLGDSDRLDAPEVRRHEWEATYTRDDYLELLSTYSGHLALEPHLREGLLDCIGRLIDDRYGGSIAKRYLFDLFVARVR